MLDGNATGGLLREVFAFEATAARITCAGCARMMPMGVLRLYAYGSAARRGDSGSTCGARQPRCPRELGLNRKFALEIMARRRSVA